MFENIEFEIVIDDEVLKQDFSDITFPFPLKNELRQLRKNEGTDYISQEIAALLKRNPELTGVTCYTSKAIKTCAVYKLRIPKDDNRGKSSGYRIIFLLLTIFGKGYVLDIADHSIRDDLSDSDKKFCGWLVNEIDKAISGKDINE